ncbi:MAG: NAD(P)H-hydrate dehydratase [Bacteroidales bacterium]|nr:NAD(P)H-hydrate dehydratase [Bacteroidales bacterium]
MKVLPVPLIRQADEYTIKNEPIADIDLMERASTACFQWIKSNFSTEIPIQVFCGTGNNGGDGFAISRMLLQSGYLLKVFITGPLDRMTPSCRTNFNRIPDGICHFLTALESLPLPEPNGIILDALIGSGLSKPVEGFTEKIIHHINSTAVPVISIDVPSGLFCDTSMRDFKDPAVIRATYTLSFAPPKLAFFFPENDSFVGHWELFDIGIHPTFLNEAPVTNYMTEVRDVRLILRRRGKFCHKGNFGHALLISGSTGKMGAAVLAAGACLRSGAGLVTVHVPSGGTGIIQTAIPEAMLSVDAAKDHFSTVPDLSAFQAIGVGPGIGTDEQSARALKLLIQESAVPTVFDADALNILSRNKTWLGFLRPGSVITPHPKEFERLAGASANHFERQQLQRDFSVKFQCFVVLKGAHTAITTPEGNCFFNSTGNPGMATGGSGDVLTGMITGLLAQGYPGSEACRLAVYLHGLAGDLALQQEGFEALIASDIIKNTGKAFQFLYGKF